MGSQLDPVTGKVRLWVAEEDENAVSISEKEDHQDQTRETTEKEARVPGNQELGPLDVDNTLDLEIKEDGEFPRLEANPGIKIKDPRELDKRRNDRERQIDQIRGFDFGTPDKRPDPAAETIVGITKGRTIVIDRLVIGLWPFVRIEGLRIETRQ